MQRQIFEFKIKTKIIFGIGTLSKLRTELKQLQVKNPLVVTDQGIVETGLLDKVANELKLTGMGLNVFDEVESNPSAETVEKGLVSFRDNECDATIGVGGGSSMDVAKAISLKVRNEDSLLDYMLWKRKLKNQGPPIVTIPTTAGTGSEVTDGIVIKDMETKNKLYVEFGEYLDKFIDDNIKELIEYFVESNNLTKEESDYIDSLDYYVHLSD